MRCPYEHTLYVKTDEHEDVVIVCLYVDDLIITGSNSKLIVEFREELASQFEMINMGLMSYFLGIEVLQTEHKIFISQRKYAADVLRRFKMESCKLILTHIQERLKLEKDGPGDLVNPTLYKQLVGSLCYLTSIKPDITIGVGLIN